MKLLIFIFYVVFACASRDAQADIWQPSPGHTQLPIWPGKPPDANLQHVTGQESVSASTGLVGGKPVLVVSDVSQPAMTVYSPQGTNTGVAMVVFPGGGYQVLAMDLEGTEICAVDAESTARLLEQTRYRDSPKRHKDPAKNSSSRQQPANP